MLGAFVVGLVMDLFQQSGGLHAMACVLTVYLCGPLTRVFFRLSEKELEGFDPFTAKNGRTAGLSLLLCLGLCVLASMRFSRQLFEPIRALNSAMREVEEGNLNVQLDNRRIDEMGQLSGRFNRMAQRLRQNLKDSLRQQRELQRQQRQQPVQCHTPP